MPRSDGRPTAPRGTLLPRGSDAAAFTAWGAALTVGPAGLPAGGCDRQADWDDQGRGGQPVVPDPLQHALDVAARPLRALPCIPRRTAVRPPAPPPPPPLRLPPSKCCLLRWRGRGQCSRCTRWIKPAEALCRPRWHRPHETPWDRRFTNGFSSGVTEKVPNSLSHWGLI